MRSNRDWHSSMLAGEVVWGAGGRVNRRARVLVECADQCGLAAAINAPAAPSGLVLPSRPAHHPSTSLTHPSLQESCTETIILWKTDMDIDTKTAAAVDLYGTIQLIYAEDVLYASEKVFELRLFMFGRNASGAPRHDHVRSQPMLRQS